MHLLKSLFYALVAFLAASSVSIGPGGAVLLQLPPIQSICSHPDQYAAGLLALVEVFSRLSPSPADHSPLSFLARLADSLLKNRAEHGGYFVNQTTLKHGLTS